MDDAIGVFRYVANLTEAGKGVKALQPDATALPDPSFTGRIIYEPAGVVSASAYRRRG